MKSSTPEDPQKSAKKKTRSEAGNSRSYGLQKQTITDGNGLIGAAQEITRDDFDHEHRAGAIARVRFENEERPRSVLNFYFNPILELISN